MTELEEIESYIVYLEIDFNPRASAAYKKKWKVKIEALRERRKVIKHNMTYPFKK